MSRILPIYFFFFFNDTATTEIYTLSLHDALPICATRKRLNGCIFCCASIPWHDCSSSDAPARKNCHRTTRCAPSCCICADRKSTRLNSSHVRISYAVFCLKKKKQEGYSRKCERHT